MSMSSDEVNFLVYRYLQESGFQHSAFTFGAESHADQSNINGPDIPPGALVSIVQRGVQYVEAEAAMTEDGTILTENGEVDQLSLMGAVRPDIVASRHALIASKVITQESVMNQVDQGEENSYSRTNSVGNADMEVDGTADDIGGQKATVLRGHESEVFVCAWNPTQDILASGSGDGTARLWPLTEGASTSPVVLFHHSKDMENHRNDTKDVTSLQWNSEGSLLATASYDGQARIWNTEGQLVTTLKEHKAPILAIKWNKKGSYLSSASFDKTTTIWDASSWEVKQSFAFHQAAALDIDWQNNTSFASCSTDKSIHICKLGMDKPVKSLTGHTSEVNSIRWDPTGSLLASCSDDLSVKIWSTKQDNCLHDFQGHKSEINSISWSPTGPNTANPNAPLYVASASIDTTIRLWEVEKGSCVLMLKKHQGAVYSISFSPDGKYLASASHDQYVYIWSTQTGSLVHTFQGKGGVYEVQWSPRGDKVAACFSDSTLSVLDVRTL